MNLRDLPLGSLIVRDGIARPATVRDALVEAQETDRRLGEVMLQHGWIRERDLARLLAEQEKLEFIDDGAGGDMILLADGAGDTVAKRSFKLLF